MNPLQLRLAGVRRQLRFVVSFRGGCWLLAAVLIMLALAGALDWRLNFPGLVRAILLAVILGAIAGIGFRHLFAPLLAHTDDLTLALRIEERYPVLNDSLASTVEFLQAPADAERTGSRQLREHAVKRGLRQAADCEFTKIVDRRGMSAAGFSLAAACALATALLVLFPVPAETALI